MASTANEIETRWNQTSFRVKQNQIKSKPSVIEPDGVNTTLSQNKTESKTNGIKAN